MTDGRDAGFDDFLDAVEDGDPYYLESPTGNGWLPPLEVDPETGERELVEHPLPQPGKIQTHTTVNVPTPRFEDDAPYVVALAGFGPVNVTGQVRGVDPEDVEIGMEVNIDVDRTETTGERLVVFRPVDK